jgi:phage gp45-like
MSDANNRRHPESTFEATYPYNQSTITRSGHEIHVNDTPDKESLRVAHTKGSYVEIDKDGRTVVNSVGKAYYYTAEGFSSTVDGHYDVKVKGVMNVNVDGSVKEETAGNRYMSAGGDFVFGVGKTLSETIVSDKYQSIGGNEIVAVKGNENKQVDGESVTSHKGLKLDLLQSDWAVNQASGGNIEIISGGNIRFKCKNFEIEAETITLKTTAGAVTITAQALDAIIQDATSIKSGSSTIIESGSSATIQSGSSVNLNGSPVLANGRAVLTT